MTASPAPPKLARHARGKRPQFYPDPTLDQAMSMIMVLASEFSVLRDRLDSVELVAKQHGVDLAGAIEKLELDAATLKRREEERTAFFNRLFYLALKQAEETGAGQTAEAFHATIEEISHG